MQCFFAGSRDQQIDEARMRAYEGDEEAAIDLIFLLPNELRGHEVSAAYENGMPQSAFRELLSAAWDQDHLEVRRAAYWNRSTLKKWFKAAQFELSHLPEKLTLYRGGVCFFKDFRNWELPLTLSRGFAWTRRREVACWFATRWSWAEARLSAFPDAFPCVVKVMVPRRLVLGHLTDRQEDEVICFTHGRRQHWIDGADEDPRLAGLRWRPSPKLVDEWRGYATLYDTKSPILD